MRSLCQHFLYSVNPSAPSDDKHLKKELTNIYFDVFKRMQLHINFTETLLKLKESLYISSAFKTLNHHL